MIHKDAIVEAHSEVGTDTYVWEFAKVRNESRVGNNCVIGQGVYIDTQVVVGDNCKIQNYACLYSGVTLEDGVFVGPHTCFTNDLYPRAVDAYLRPLNSTDWSTVPTKVCRGASIGAGAVIVCGITIGEFAMVGSGSVVTKNVEPFALVVGNPARRIGWVDHAGKKVVNPPSSR